MLVITIFLVVGMSGLIWWKLRTSKYHRLLATIPGPSTVPLFGNSLQFRSDSVEFFNQLLEICDNYDGTSPIYKLMLGHKPLMVIFRASAAEKLMSSMENISKAFPYRFAQPWLRAGLITSTGEKWQFCRKLLTPSFHFQILADFQQVFNEQAQILVEQLEEKCDGPPFDIFPKISMCTLDVICETTMGLKIKAQTSVEKSDYIKAVTGFSDIFYTRSRKPWQWIDFIYKRTGAGKRHDAYIKTLHDFTQKVILKRIEEREERADEDNDNQADVKGERGRQCPRPFLDQLLEMRKEGNFTSEDIQEQVDTFMFAGHDTTAAGIIWTIQMIGSHPEVQKKLHDELDTLFGESSRPLAIEDLPSLKYLDCVIKESLRLYPPVPWIGRTAGEDIDIDGMTVPEGASVSILIYRINRDPDNFPDPEKFDPDRFGPDAFVRNPYAYIPFSAGPRNCIGQRFALNEIKSVLSAILRKYSIESTQTIEEIHPVPEIVLRPSNGVKVKLTRKGI